MNILYIGDNRDVINWGCRATSKALRDILSVKHSIIHTICRSEIQSPAFLTNGNFPGFLRDFTIRNRKTRGVRLLYKQYLKLGGGKDFLTNDLKRNCDFFLKNSTSIPYFQKLLKQITECDAIIINGEGSFIFSDPPRRDTLFYLFMLQLGQSYNKKTYILNAMMSDCPRTGFNNNLFNQSKEIFDKCSLITIRDPLSFQYINKKVTASNIEFIPDALFTWNKYFVDKPILPIIGDSIIPFMDDDRYWNKYDFSKPYIVISGSSSAAWTPNVAVPAYISLVEKIKSLNINIFIVPTCSGDSFLSEVSHATSVPFLPVNMPIVMGAIILGRASLMISGRFHPSILASLGGTPCVFMGSNSHKNIGLQMLLDYCDQVEYNAIPTEEDINMIFKRSILLLEKNGAIRDEIVSNVDVLSKKAFDVIEKI